MRCALCRKCTASAGGQVPVILERGDLSVEGPQLGAARSGKQLLELCTEVLADEGTAFECKCGFVPVGGQGCAGAIAIRVATHGLAGLDLVCNAAMHPGEHQRCQQVRID